MDSTVRLLNEILSVTSPEAKGVKQLREVVSVESWLENPFYCGEDGAYLYDFWKEELCDYFKSGLPEWILYGSLGGGKTSCASVALIRKLYELSCYDCVPLLFNLMRSTVIYMIYFSVSLTQANRTGYGKIQKMVDAIPYFQRHYPRNERITSELQFPNLHIAYGSSAAHQIGLDLLGAILDEGDFFKVSNAKALEEYSVAREIYTSIANRRKLRFSVNGEDKGISLLISSPSYGSDFVEKRIAQAKSRKTAKVTYVVGYQVTPSKYRGTWFYVFPGNTDVDPLIIDTEDDLNTLLEMTETKESEQVRKWTLLERVEYHRDVLDIQKVPDDFRESFEDDILKAIRDIVGKSSRPVAGYLTAEQAASVDKNWLQHPFTKQALVLSTKNDVRIEHFIRKELLANPDIPRCIHIDQSVTTDRTGIACSYVCANSLKVESDPWVTVEFMLALVPPSTGEIPILRCVEFVVWLRDQGYEINFVTMDSYQSRASLQYLDSEGISCDIYSVDRDDSAYVTVRNLTLRGMLYTYDYPLYKREVKNLIWNRKRRKVDHPPNHSKDVSDAVAGSVYQAVLRNGIVPSFRSVGTDSKEIMKKLLDETEWSEF